MRFLPCLVQSRTGQHILVCGGENSGVVWCVRKLWTWGALNSQFLSGTVLRFSIPNCVESCQKG